MKFIFCLILGLSLTSHSQIRIASKGFNMNESDLRIIFKSAVTTLPKADNFKDPSLFVSKHQRGPITLFQRTPRGEVAIQLNSGDYYYSQCIYQFAHELAHVRADFQPISHQNKWLEETLCETASLFVLRKISKEWGKNAPNDALKNYRKHLATYATTVMKSRESLTTKTSPVFYKKHEKTLRSQPPNAKLTEPSLTSFFLFLKKNQYIGRFFLNSLGSKDPLLPNTLPPGAKTLQRITMIF